MKHIIYDARFFTGCSLALAADVLHAGADVLGKVARRVARHG